MEIIRMAEELRAIPPQVDHEHVVVIVVNVAGTVDRQLAVDQFLPHVGAVVADAQQVGIERIETDPVRRA